MNINFIKSNIILIFSSLILFGQGGMNEKVSNLFLNLDTTKSQKTMKNTQEEQIIDCENRLLEAMKIGDINVLDELLHDNLIFNIPTGQTVTKSMDIENYRSGIMTIYEISTSDRIIETFENTSIVSVTAYLKAKYADQVIEGTFKYLRVWQLFNNSWKIIGGSGFQI